MKISILCPVHNEQENLEELVARVVEVMRKTEDDNEWELLLVDDNSDDRSGSMIDELAARDRRVRGFHHTGKRGQTGAFSTGFKNASGGVVVTMDADLQIFPEDIPLLLAKMREGYQLVNALRRKRQDTPAIVASSRLYNLLMKVFFRCPVRDAASNFAAIDASFLRDLPLQDNDHRYLIPILQSRGLTRIGEVEVQHQRRERGTSKYGIGKAITGLPELLRAYGRVRRGVYQ